MDIKEYKALLDKEMDAEDGYHFCLGLALIAEQLERLADHIVADPVIGLANLLDGFQDKL